MTVRIDLCRNFEKIVELETGAFIGNVKRHEPGAWRLTVSADEFATIEPEDDEAIDSILVRDGSRVLFSGLVTPIRTGLGGLETKYAPSGDSRIYTGPDAWGSLRSRLAFPDPTSPEPWATEQDIRTGVASTVIAEFIEANLGSSALPDRIDEHGVDIIDPSTGTAGTWAARAEPLDELVSRICQETGIVCRPTFDETGRLTVTLATPADRSNQIRLSDQGDLVAAQTRKVSAAATWVLGAGEGTGTDRAFVSASSGVTGRERREIVTAQPALTIEQLQQHTAAKLAAYGPATAVSATISQTAAQQLTYLDDYEVGDLIATDIDGTALLVPVVAVRIEVNAEFQATTPLLGAVVADRFTGLTVDVADLTARLNSQLS